MNPTKVHLHLPWLSYERAAIKLGNHVDVFAALPPAQQEAYLNYARVHHPAWGRLTQGARKLHARNGRILFPDRVPGKPVDLVLAWPSATGGGTGQGMRMAEAEGIPLVDLYRMRIDYEPGALQPDLHALCERIRGMK